jgi:hypothetical protein
MARSKRSRHTRHSTPAGLSHIYAHISPTRSKPRYQRHLNLDQRHGGTSHRREDDSEDTYLSLLRSIHDVEDDDSASSDETDAGAGSDDQLEDWDEEIALVEMLGSPYSIPFSLYYTRFFCSSEGVQRIRRRTHPPGAHPRVCGRFP